MTSISNSLDYSKLYNVSESNATRPYRLDIREDSENLSRTERNELIHGRFLLSKPLQFDAYRGGQAADFLWSTSLVLVGISSRVIDLLKSNKISGWSTYPVEIFDRKGGLLPGYYGFAVTGPICTLDRSRSEIVDKPAPVPTGRGYQVYRGLYFDESQWDGSDMFWVSNGATIVTEKVYQLFKKHKVTNILLERLDQHDTYKGVSNAV